VAAGAEGPFAAQHYAFRVSDAKFDEIVARLSYARQPKARSE
jgi:hypothetical protein